MCALLYPQPNIANRDGETPLHFAIQKMQVGRPMTLVKLLQGGATADLKNNAGDTPLTLAARLNKIGEDPYISPLSCKMPLCGIV